MRQKGQSPGSRAIRTVLATAVVALCVPVTAGASVAPLPQSDYTTHPLCSPPAPGEATCLATELIPRTAAARAHTHPLGVTTGSVASPTLRTGAWGFGPNNLRSAYFPGERPDAPVGEPQTIALVDAYDDPDAESDLRVYSEAFGLPVLSFCAAGAVSGCFEKVNQNGETGNLPVAGDQQEVELASQWAGETSIDVEVAHGICRNCRILLVEASSAGELALEAAEKTAERLGATEISNSWTGGERNESIESPFNDPGIVITAGAGDWGYRDWAKGDEYENGVDFPASSPNVIAVGGTKLTLTEAGTRASETVWNEDVSKEKDATGGGCSQLFSAPPWQTAVPDWAAVGCGTGEQAKRAVADVAADGDPDTGVAIYDSVSYYLSPGFAVRPGWVTIGGSSVSSPIVASLYALVGGAHGVPYPAATLYSHLGGASLYDVTEGGDGKCDGVYASGCEGSLSSPLDCGEGALICNAGSGYDGPSGVGAPAGLAAFEAGPEAGHSERLAAREAAAKKAEEEQKAAEHKAEEERRAAEEKAREERRPAEEKRIAEQEERKAAEKRKTEEERKIAEQKAEEAREAAEAQAQAQRAKAIAIQEREAAELAMAARRKTEIEQQLKLAEEDWRRIAEPLSGGPSDGAVRLSGLALTATTSAAVAHSRTTLSQLSFAFNLSAAARVRVTLSRLLVQHGHRRWAAATRPLTLSPARGHDHARLSGRTTLAPATYRLTLAALHGTARSIVFTTRASR